MTVTREQFLHAWQFTGDPFFTTNAEQERDQLGEYFVRAPLFERLVGDPRLPETLVVFAPRGYGKSSHRLEVERWATTRREPPALAVTFTDMDLLLEPAQASLAEYMAIIRRLTLESLDRVLQAQPKRNIPFRQRPEYEQFVALLNLFAPRSLSQHTITTEVKRLMTVYQQLRLSAKEWLHTLAEIANAAGFASIYVLIDGVDEHHTIRATPELAAELLSPLLDAPGLLQECGFAFKFFLPDILEHHLQVNRIGRFDRVPIVRLAWSREELTRMLRQRLASFSVLNPMSVAARSFNDLCEIGIDAEQALLDAADGSPRELLKIAAALVDAHCSRIADPSLPIRAATIRTVLGIEGDLLAYAVSDQSATAKSAEAPAFTSQPPPSDGSIPLLYLDPRGDLWVGSTCRTEQPLPRLIRACMEYLWKHRARTITYEELEQALYGSDDEQDDAKIGSRGDPRGSIEKIVRRLRETIEPGEQASQRYIVVQRGTGYVLRNTRD